MKTKRIMSVMLCIAMIMSVIVVPSANAAANAEWKMLKISNERTKAQYSMTDLNYEDPETGEVGKIMYGHSPVDITKDDTLLKIEFSMQYTQNYNISLYRLKDGLTLNRHQQDDNGSCNDSEMISNYFNSIRDDGVGDAYLEYDGESPDPRGEFLGYLQICDENGDEQYIAQGYEYIGYEEMDIPYRQPLISLMSLGYADGTNTVYWNGKVSLDGFVSEKPVVDVENGEELIIAIEPQGKEVPVVDENGEETGENALTNWAAVYMTFTGLLVGAEEEGGNPDIACIDPVNPATGNFYWSYTDLSVLGNYPVEFTRYYNSQGGYSGAFGNGWRHAWNMSIDDQKYTASVLFPDGKEEHFELQKDGTYAAAVGSNYTLTWSGAFTLTQNNGYVYTFNSDNKLESINYCGKDIYTLSYDNGMLTRISNGEGYIDLNYADDKITSISDNEGRTISYEYDGANNLIKSINPDGDSLEYSYDENNNLTSIKDFNGNIYIENQYNNNHAVVWQNVIERGESSIEYDRENHVNIVTNFNGAVTEYYYNSSNDIIKVVETSNGAQSETIYENNRVVSEIDELGNTTSYEYNESGRPTRITYPDGTSTEISYNSQGLAENVYNADGTTITYEYDSHGNCIKLTDQNGNSTEFTYDDNNNMLTKTDSLGNTTKFEYDSLGNVISATNPKGDTTYYEYDSVGRLIKETTAGGIVTSYEYTTAGKLVTITNNNGDVQTFTQNSNGYTESITDYIGNTAYASYDRLNQPVSITDFEGNTSTYTYDALGNVISQTDPDGNTISYEYDLNGNLISATDAMGNTSYFSYDLKVSLYLQLMRCPTAQLLIMIRWEEHCVLLLRTVLQRHIPTIQWAE